MKWVFATLLAASVVFSPLNAFAQCESGSCSVSPGQFPGQAVPVPTVARLRASQRPLNPAPLPVVARTIPFQPQLVYRIVRVTARPQRLPQSSSVQVAVAAPRTTTQPRTYSSSEWRAVQQQKPAAERQFIPAMDVVKAKKLVRAPQQLIDREQIVIEISVAIAHILEGHLAKMENLLRESMSPESVEQEKVASN